MKKTSLKDHLKEKIPEKELQEINRSFEVIGDIAIIEVPEGMEKWEKEIAESLMKVNKNIKVVLKKSGIHEGEFRTQSMDFVAGERRKETIYPENGIRLLLNVEDVYFSSKLGTERERLSKGVREGSRVLVMFSGCGPYTFNILRKQPDVKVIDSIEINPKGHEYALRNLELNKNLLKKSKRFKEEIERLKEKGEYISEKEMVKRLNDEVIHFYNGDVRDVIKKEIKDRKYDEIFMPLPKDAEHFLDCAFAVGDKGCLVHMYDFVHENDFPHESERKVKLSAKEHGKEVEIIETRKVGQYSPRKFRVCCDFRIR